MSAHVDSVLRVSNKGVIVPHSRYIFSYPAHAFRLLEYRNTLLHSCLYRTFPAHRTVRFGTNHAH